MSPFHQRIDAPSPGCNGNSSNMTGRDRIGSNRIAAAGQPSNRAAEGDPRAARITGSGAITRKTKIGKNGKMERAGSGPSLRNNCRFRNPIGTRTPANSPEESYPKCFTHGGAGPFPNDAAIKPFDLRGGSLFIRQNRLHVRKETLSRGGMEIYL